MSQTTESIQLTKEVIREIAPVLKGAISKVKDKTSKLFEKLQKKYIKHVIYTIIILLVLLFLIYAWYQCIQDWITYGFDPNDRTYKKALSTITFAGVITVISIIVMVILRFV
jgi:Fe2+ transport system protein B